LRGKTIGRLIAIAAVSATTCLLAGEECHNGAAVTCRVKLGKNGGTGGDDYVTATIGKPMPTPRIAPKRSGWKFDGYWDTLKTDAKGNPLGKQYYNAKMRSVRNWDKDKDGAAKLWAKWTERPTLGKLVSGWTSIAWLATFLLALMAIAGVIRRIRGGEGALETGLRPSEMSAETSNKLRNLGLVLAIFVVLMHAAFGFDASGIGGPAGWLYSSLKRVYAMAVPSFLLISGYLLAGRSDGPGWYRSVVSKRLKTLLVPFVLWSLLWVAYLFVRTVLLNAVGSQPLFDGLKPWMEKSSYLGLDPVAHPMLGPLWYVRTLLVLVAVSPILMWMLARGKWFVLACAFLVCVFRPENKLCTGNISYTIIYVFGFGYVFYFLAGMALRLGLVKVPGRGCRILLALCGIACICVYNVISGMQFKNVEIVKKVMCALNFPPLFCLLWVVVSQRKWPMWLTGMSFPIYLVHWFALDLHRRLFFARFDTLGQLLFRYAWMVLLSAAIVAVLRLLPKKANEVLFGGR